MMNYSNYPHFRADPDGTMTELSHWETVCIDEPNIRRLVTPGGWLYLMGDTMVFVPDPTPTSSTGF